MSAPLLATPQFIKICSIVQKAYGGISNRDMPVSVLDWQNLVENRLSQKSPNFKVNIQGFPRQGAQIRGALVRRITTSDIFFSNSESFCWQRYIATKELAHLLIDEENSYTLHPSSLIEQLISGVPLWLLRNDSQQDSQAFESEKMAMIAATEMLLPWHHRNYFKECCNKGMNNLEIAEAFKVPKNIVSNMLTPTYWACTESANSYIEANPDP